MGRRRCSLFVASMRLFTLIRFYLSNTDVSAQLTLIVRDCYSEERNEDAEDAASIQCFAQDAARG